MSDKNKPIPQVQPLPWQAYLDPRNWLLFLAVGLFYLLTLLPAALLCQLGRFLGLLLMKLSKRRRHIAQVNVDLCFPELSAQERARIVHDHFVSLGISFLELGWAWWAGDRRLRRWITVDGAEHLQQALARGKGVILLGSHLTTMEIGIRLLLAGLRPPLYLTYRANDNPVIDYLINRNRTLHDVRIVPHTDIRGMLRGLKDNGVLWYAPDQGYKGKTAEFVPFFGIPVSTHTATSRLAESSGAAVVPFFMRRTGAGRYHLTLKPALDNFPSGDPVADTLRYHQLVEENIRKAPEQYLWVHRRFKHLPEGEADVYARAKRA